MKKVALVFGTFLTLFFFACEGPRGIDGLDGRDGLDGLDGEPGALSPAFEIDIDLVLDTNVNAYAFGPATFPEDLPVLSNTETVLVYRLEEVSDGVDIWRQLPQPFFSDQGLLFYNFDFTAGDYTIFAEPEFDLALMPAELVQNQIFRVVLVPIELLSASKTDLSNIDSVMRILGLEEGDFQKIEAK
ncbi:MAG: collagen-like protein [Bacteroidota bacterium]